MSKVETKPISLVFIEFSCEITFVCKDGKLMSFYIQILLTSINELNVVSQTMKFGKLYGNSIVKNMHDNKKEWSKRFELLNPILFIVFVGFRI